MPQAPAPPALLVALLLAAAPRARAAVFGDYGTDATCSVMVYAPEVAWGGACWGGSYQYGKGTPWVNGISQGNTIAFSIPYLGNISVWDAWALTSCAPGTITIGTWTNRPLHPNYCSGAPAQQLTLPLNVCKLDAISGTYKKLLDGASCTRWLAEHA